MDWQTLELFCRQLAHWAEGAMESGRSPFRRAETFPRLLTAAGELSPPLVLWINRDSCMAGAILLFPDRQAEESLAEGRACAQALGLRHFVTWASTEIVIWEETGDSAVRRKDLPAAPAETGSAEHFSHLFRTLLGELKPLSIIGAMGPAELSPYYFANLCTLARLATTPVLSEAFSVAKSEGITANIAAPASAALQQVQLTIIRLLALLIEDRLPPIAEPDGFDRILHFALDSLPPAIRRSLDFHPWEIPLPPAAAVRLQSLLRRLTQLDFAKDRSRCLQTLDILLQNAAAELSGAPLPPLPPDIPDTSAAALLLNPDRCYPAKEVLAEVASPSLLAFTALLRHLREDSPVMQAAHPIAIGEISPPPLIRGHLSVSHTLTASDRRLLAARLRLSWPNRRFSLTPDAPRWMFEFLHLLGLMGDGSRMVLALPDGWLTAPYGGVLHNLLRDQFALAGLRRDPAGVCLHLHRGTESVATTVLKGTAGERRISWARLRKEPHSFLPLSLDLPEPLFTLLQEDKLQVPVHWPDGKEDGIYHFSRSSIGRLLWRVVGGGRPLPGRKSLLSHLQRQGFPLPADNILHILQTMCGSADAEPPISLIDKKLACWLGIDPVVVASGKVKQTGRTRRASVAEKLMEEIRNKVFVDGMPRFPEHFLYDYYRPQLIEYRFAAPLELGVEFMGQQKLVDREGKVLLVEGSETAFALLLASFGGGDQVHLPSDRHLTEAIVDRYLNRLRTLRQGLIRESHRMLTDPDLAQSLVGKIWKNLPLPPWELVVGRFGSPTGRS